MVLMKLKQDAEAYMDDFIKGLNDGANAGDDKKKAAYYANQFHYLFRSYHYTHGGALGWGSENGTCAAQGFLFGGVGDDNAGCGNFLGRCGFNQYSVR